MRVGGGGEILVLLSLLHVHAVFKSLVIKKKYPSKNLKKQKFHKKKKKNTATLTEKKRMKTVRRLGESEKHHQRLYAQHASARRTPPSLFSYCRLIWVCRVSVNRF